MPRLPRMVEALFDCLPADNGRVLAERLTQRLGRPINAVRAYILISQVRHNAAQYGFTIPHVDRAVDRQFIRVPVAHDFEYRLTASSRRKATDGAMANVLHIAQRVLNEFTALKAIAVQMPPSAERAKLEELAEDFGDVKRKTARIVRFIRAANGN